MIEILDVWKSFDGKQVLKGVNLEIKDREIMVIIGGSGSGKTVLLKLIIGLLKPDNGEIQVFGEDITKIKERDMGRIRKKFGMVFQEAALFDSLTIKENVGFFLREHSLLPEDAISKKVEEKLEIVGLKGIGDLKPAMLSGGMKKRVALARAIVTDPEVILYDEPTTGVDPVMAEVINKLIKDLQLQLSLTSVVVTHDIGSAFKIADRVAMLYDGRIIMVGTPEELKRSEDPKIRQFIS
jgi:phospholipid/cholesterol/gamma-HCH transport system ATP-binding protein